MVIFTQVWVSRYEIYRFFRGLTGFQRTPRVWGVTYLVSIYIREVTLETSYFNLLIQNAKQYSHILEFLFTLNIIDMTIKNHH